MIPHPFTQNPAVQLLLACARPYPDLSIINRIHQLVREPLDWDYFVGTAQRNRVLPLVYRSLKQQACSEQVPDGVMQRMRKNCSAMAARSLLLSTRLLILLKLFNDNNILAVPLKGPVQAESLYGDLVLRSFDDLDILVHPLDALEAWKLLLLQGYEPSVKLTEERLATYLKTEYSMEFSLKGRVTVDLHWDAAGRYLGRSFGLQLFGDRLEKSTLNGEEVYQPPPEYLLVYQCVHGSKSCWQHLEAVCTVAELIRSCPEMEWSALQRFAREMHCSLMLNLGCYLAYALLDAAPPAGILEPAKNSRCIQGLGAEICKKFFCEEEGAAERGGCSDFSSFHLKVRDRVSDKMRYGASLVFRPSRQEWRLFRLPEVFFFLYYPLRVMRLLWGFSIAKLRSPKKPFWVLI